MKTEIVSTKYSELGTFAKIVYATNAFLILLGSGGCGKTSSAKGVIAPALEKLFGTAVDVWKSNFSNASPLEITGYGALKKGEHGEDLMVFAEPQGLPTVGNLTRTGNGDPDGWCCGCWMSSQIGRATVSPSSAVPSTPMVRRPLVSTGWARTSRFSSPPTGELMDHVPPLPMPQSSAVPILVCLSLT